jgi:hypothetical protein
MGRTSVFALAAGAVLALAACGDSREPLATEPRLKPTPPGPSCNTSDAKSKVRSHFGQPTQNEVVEMIDLLIASSTAADSTKNGFDALKRVELGQDVAGTPQTALDLVNAILPCIKVGATSIGPVGIFETEGAFAIRGGTGDAAPVYSGDDFSAVAPPASPAEFDTWSEWLGLPDGTTFPDPRAIIYGTPFDVGNISNESEVGSRGFDWNTLPTRSFPRPADGFLGLCVGSNLSDRIQNNHGTQQGVLGFYDPSQPPLSLSCAGFDQNGNPLVSTSLLHRAMDLLGPQPLFAAVRLGGTGGTPGGYSQHFGVLVTQAALRFTVQPSSAKIGDVISPPVKVEAKTAAGTPIQRIEVTIEARSNLGQPASLGGLTTRRTDEFGIVTFDDLVLNSSGTYRFQVFATNGAENLNVSTATSNQFFVGKKTK